MENKNVQRRMKRNIYVSFYKRVAVSRLGRETPSQSSPFSFPAGGASGGAFGPLALQPPPPTPHHHQLRQLLRYLRPPLGGGFYLYNKSRKRIKCPGRLQRGYCCVVKVRVATVSSASFFLPNDIRRTPPQTHARTNACSCMCVYAQWASGGVFSR